jgi:NAD+ kinase
MNLAVRGDDSDVREAVAASGASLGSAADADALLAVGESAFISLTDDPVPAPVLPVDAGLGPHSVPRSDLRSVLDALAAGDYRVVDHPHLSVTVNGDTAGDALLDVTLVTTQAAEISEFSVRAESVSVDSFRADGVVVATPAGSTGYARAVDGPILSAGTGLVAVPVAPYATVADSWVLRPPIRLGIERDDADVSLVLDDEVCRHLAPDDVVAVESVRTVSLLAVAGVGPQS